MRSLRPAFPSLDHRLQRTAMISVSLLVAATLSVPTAWAGGSHRARTFPPGLLGARPYTPSPGQYNVLMDVSVDSSTDGWAVGYDGGVLTTLTLRWRGSKWMQVASPNPGAGDNVLWGVSSLSSNDAWAVGWGDQSGGFVLHWDGTSWTPQTTPHVGNLLGVGAISSTDVWAVGFDGNRAVALHYDGTAWTQVDLPPVGPNYSQLWGVTATSPTDVWAVGYDEDATWTQRSLILHFDGTTWTRMDSPSPAGSPTLQRVSAASPSDAWAVGYNGSDDSEFETTLTLHWDGATWSKVKSPNPGHRTDLLNDVSVVSANDVWAAGTAFRRTAGIYQTLILHWDGTSWSHVKSANPSSGWNGLWGVSAVSSKKAWAVGSYDAVNGKAVTRTLVEQWDGTAWSKV